MACLTQIEVDKIWDHVSKLCRICFAPYGSTYTTVATNVLVINTGFRLITENAVFIEVVLPTTTFLPEPQFLQTDGGLDILLDNGNNMEKD